MPMQLISDLQLTTGTKINLTVSKHERNNLAHLLTAVKISTPLPIITHFLSRWNGQLEDLFETNPFQTLVLIVGFYPIF